MPYRSRAQAAFFHMNQDKIGSAVVADFDIASKGKRLPERVAKGTEGKARELRKKRAIDLSGISWTTNE